MGLTHPGSPLGTEGERIINSSVSTRGMAIFMAFEADSTTPPTIVKSSVGRAREYLTGAEVEMLMAAARKSSRYGHRDATMILIVYRHGSSGLGSLRSAMAPGRADRGGCMSAAANAGPLASIQSEVTRSVPCAACSANSRRARMSLLRARWSDRAEELPYVDRRLGVRAGMPFPIHPHMLAA